MFIGISSTKVRYCHLRRSKLVVRCATRPAESRGDLWGGRAEQSTAEERRGEEGEERGGVRVASYVAQPTDCHLASQSDKIFTDKSLPLMLDMSRDQIKIQNEPIFEVLCPW